MNLRHDIHNLLEEIGFGRMIPTAYDTAWVAKLKNIGEPIGQSALEWLRAHQLPDGSWGAKEPYYHHDRIICTLAAMSALAKQKKKQDIVRLQRAGSALEAAIKGLASDPATTIGFELIAPTLWSEVNKSMSNVASGQNGFLKRLIPQRTAKLAALPRGMVDRAVTVAFSSEMAGSDGQHLLNAEDLQESNGSVGHSPSATAYFTLNVRKRDAKALDYLRTVAPQGAAPNVAPFDVFEPAWVLWNLMLTDSMGPQSLALAQPHLDFLESTWIPGKGIGHAAGYTPKDGDDTSLVYEVLSRFGRAVDLDAVLHYEHVYYFRCFELESSPSISTNIHVLGALREAGLDKRHPVTKKVINFLREVRTDKTFWFDKWHASPYYATSHGIIACAGYVDELIEDAVSWILSTQNENGSWGYYMPTAEETAYCLQALAVWKRQGYSVPSEALEQGSEWLYKQSEPPYPPLWIGKCLYCPEMVIKSAVLSALMLVDE
jgi:halimadienyl-diphosphate synthase